MRLLVLLAALLAGCAAPVAPSAAHAPTWLALHGGPTARVEVASAVLDGKIYAIGGFLEGGAATSLVETYDPSKDAWARAPDLPIALNHAAAAAVDGMGVYVFGGWVTTPAGAAAPTPTATPLAWKLSPGAASWTPVAPMPAPRAAHAAAALAGKVYVVGGLDASLQLTPDVWAYDPKADAWSAGPALPTPRDHLATAVLDGKLHVIDGQKASHANVVDAHEALDPATGTWSALAPAPLARNAMVAAALGGKLVVAGGQTDKDVFAAVEQYDPARDAWTTLAPMPTARHGFAGGVVGDRFYALLGGTAAGSPDNLSHAVESLGADR